MAGSRAPDYDTVVADDGSPTAHPIVDCGPLLGESGGDAAAVAAVGRRMIAALVNRGYFYADAEAVLPMALMRQAYSATASAHALPEELKASYVGLERARLYFSPSGAEDDYEVGTKASCAVWSFGRTGLEGRLPALAASEPASMHEFDAFADTLYAAQDRLADAVMLALAAGLGLPPDAFAQHRGGDLGTIRFMSYPPAEPVSSEDDRGISAHTDFEFFTLMHQDSEGLQFMLPPTAPEGAGQWTDAPVRPGQFVIIVGDMLERWTNGFLRSTPHRVLTKPWQRHSIIRFVAVHPSTLVEPLPPFVTAERPAAYTPVTMQEHMDVTLRNLDEGKGAWDRETERSLTATYVYGEASSSKL